MSDTFSKVEVITGVARQRRFSTDLKLAGVAETMQPGVRSAMLPDATACHLAWYSAGVVDERRQQRAVRADDHAVAASELRRLPTPDLRTDSLGRLNRVEAV